MKKTITKPDGTQEVVEGTAEEIAAYERHVRQEPVKEEVKKPGLLTDELQRLGGIDWQKVFEKMPPQVQWPRHSTFCEITVAQNGWLSTIPPRCTCGAVADPWADPYPWYKITCSSTFITTCPDCGMSTGGLNTNQLCNCARGADGKVLAESNVEARDTYRRLMESVDGIKITYTTNHTQHSSLGKFF